MKFKDKYPYYRIGEFAKNLGVTPDLLKHYEAIGLIQSEADENGYRYFPFHASSLLLACMGLKNFGLSLKNIRSLLQNQSVEEAIEQIASLPFKWKMSFLFASRCWKKTVRIRIG